MTFAKPILTGLYERMTFDIPIGERGDNFDRYMVRMREMEQSLRIVEQCAGLLSLSRTPPAARRHRAGRGDTRRPDAKTGQAGYACRPTSRGRKKAVSKDILAADRRYRHPSQGRYIYFDRRIDLPFQIFHDRPRHPAAQRRSLFFRRRRQRRAGLFHRLRRDGPAVPAPSPRALPSSRWPRSRN